MGLWWQAMAIFVHVNTAILILALLPSPRPVRFIRFLINKFSPPWKLYLAVSIPCLISFLDSLHELNKYSSIEYEIYGDFSTKKDVRIAVKQAQRNYWMSGAAFLMCLFVPRMFSIIKQNGIRDEQLDTVKRAIKILREVTRVCDVDYQRDGNNDFPPNPGMPPPPPPSGPGDVPQSRDLAQGILQALRRELDRVEQENNLGDTSNGLRLNELEEIFKLYERRRILLDERRQLQQQPGRPRFPFSYNNAVPNGVGYEFNHLQGRPRGPQAIPAYRRPFNYFG